MASGDNEHRMLFDLRGKRRNVVKVVYATLAVLMGLSLFLVIGGFNIAELFQSNNAAGEAAEQFEEQAERIEVKLKKDPENPDLLVALTRAQINTGNSLVTFDEDSGQQILTREAFQEYQKATDTWSKYLEASDEPSVGLALLMGPTLFRMAEYSRSLQEVRRNVTSAAEAQKIVAEQRPSINAFSTLAYYTYFTGDFEAAEAAKAEAKKLARGKSEVEAVEKQLKEASQLAATFNKELKQSEKQAKAGGGGAGGEVPLEEGQNPLGGALSGVGE